MGRENVFFIALDKALNCPAATLGTWGSESKGNQSGLIVLSLPERGAGVRTRKEQKNEIIKIERVTGNWDYLSG